MKARTAVALGVAAVLVIGIVALIEGKRAAATRTNQPPAKVAAVLQQIKHVNAPLPERQTQAKMLIMAAHLQGKIPEASNWCERLNAGRSIWPAIPTNTVFALNTNVAGKAFSRNVGGDTVVFFEAANAGWNLAGGAELLAANSDAVAVGFADGRALIVSPAEAAGLRWTP
jgi:hypothetical protein